MQEMTPTEYRRFMLDTVRTGKLATVRADGSPHVTPIWFDLDGDDLFFTTWEHSVKAANIRRDPRVSLCVDDEKPPFAYVLVEGMAAVVTPPLDEMLRWTTRIAGRYMGQALAEAYGKRNAVEGELLIRLTPGKIIARKGIADW